ncbi:hypothetical protein RIF29_39708 [Crotalaria pallida]|uniref:Uncharacterized protein n=1 Tax=Crotalaria pallida TaxID=3830 RepID=A0AAN9E1N7_CROPI
MPITKQKKNVAQSDFAHSIKTPTSSFYQNTSSSTVYLKLHSIYQNSNLHARPPPTSTLERHQPPPVPSFRSATRLSPLPDRYPADLRSNLSRGRLTIRSPSPPATDPTTFDLQLKPLSSLAAEYQSGTPIFLKNIKVINILLPWFIGYLVLICKLWQIALRCS